MWGDSNYAFTVDDLDTQLPQVVAAANAQQGDGLVVRQSGPGKGYGLFATRNFPAGARLTRYGGAVVDFDTAEGPYVIVSVKRRGHVARDASHGFRPGEKGRWINDPWTEPLPGEWLEDAQKRWHQRQNAKLVVKDDDDGNWWFVSTRPIAAGEEILWDYGDGYVRSSWYAHMDPDTERVLNYIRGGDLVPDDYAQLRQRFPYYRRDDGGQTLFALFDELQWPETGLSDVERLALRTAGPGDQETVERYALRAPPRNEKMWWFAPNSRGSYAQNAWSVYEPSMTKGYPVLDSIRWNTVMRDPQLKIWERKAMALLALPTSTYEELIDIWTRLPQYWLSGGNLADDRYRTYLSNQLSSLLERRCAIRRLLEESGEASHIPLQLFIGDEGVDLARVQRNVLLQLMLGSGFGDPQALQDFHNYWPGWSKSPQRLLAYYDLFLDGKELEPYIIDAPEAKAAPAKMADLRTITPAQIAGWVIPGELVQGHEELIAILAAAGMADNEALTIDQLVVHLSVWLKSKESPWIPYIGVPWETLKTARKILQVLELGIGEQSLAGNANYVALAQRISDTLRKFKEADERSSKEREERKAAQDKAKREAKAELDALKKAEKGSRRSQKDSDKAQHEMALKRREAKLRELAEKRGEKFDSEVLLAKKDRKKPPLPLNNWVQWFLKFENLKNYVRRGVEEGSTRVENDSKWLLNKLRKYAENHSNDLAELVLPDKEKEDNTWERVAMRYQQLVDAVQIRGPRGTLTGDFVAGWVKSIGPIEDIVIPTDIVVPAPQPRTYFGKGLKRKEVRFASPPSDAMDEGDDDDDADDGNTPEPSPPSPPSEPSLPSPTEMTLRGTDARLQQVQEALNQAMDLYRFRLETVQRATAPMIKKLAENDLKTARDAVFTTVAELFMIVGQDPVPEFRESNGQPFEEWIAQVERFIQDRRRDIARQIEELNRPPPPPPPKEDAADQAAIKAAFETGNLRNVIAVWELVERHYPIGVSVGNDHPYVAGMVPAWRRKINEFRQHYDALALLLERNGDLLLSDADELRRELTNVHHHGEGLFAKAMRAALERMLMLERMRDDDPSYWDTFIDALRPALGRYFGNPNMVQPRLWPAGASLIDLDDAMMGRVSRSKLGSQDAEDDMTMARDALRRYFGKSRTVEGKAGSQANRLEFWEAMRTQWNALIGSAGGESSGKRTKIKSVLPE